MQTDTTNRQQSVDVPPQEARSTDAGAGALALAAYRELDSIQSRQRKPPEDRLARDRREEQFFADYLNDMAVQANRKTYPDGTSSKTQADGSRLDYDKDGKLSKLTYKDGTYREFRWAGDKLTATRTRDARWFERVEGNESAWRERKSGSVWNGDITVNAEDGTYRLKGKSGDKGSSLVSRSDGSSDSIAADGTRTVTYGNKGSESYARDGRLTKMVTEDGTIRTFAYHQDGSLTGVNVKKPDGQVYDWKLYTDGKWRCNGDLSENKFQVDAKNGKYIWTDKSNEKHTLDAKGNERIENSDKTVDISHGELVGMRKGKSELKVERNQSGEPTKIQYEAHELRKQQDGSWKRYSRETGKEEPDGLTRKGNPNIDKTTGDVLFLSGEGTIIRQQLGRNAEAIKVPESIGHKISASGLDEHAKMRMIQNIHDFMERTDIPGGAREKERTLEQVTRLLEGEAKEPFKKADCEKLAEQLSFHVAHPEQDAQGQHPTCNVSDVRICLEREQPATFARFIADSVLNGKFVTASGVVITPPRNESLLPGKEESDWQQGSESRSWIGKISDVMMANVHWRRRETDPQNNPVARGSLYYDEVRPTGQGDTGSRIYRYQKNGDDWYRYELAKAPSLYASSIEDIFQQITGKPETGRMVVHESRSAGAGVAVVRSLDDLKEQLTHGPWPKIMEVRNEVLQGQKPDGTETEHVVVVIGYDRKTGKVAIDNSHGTDEDMLTPDKQISVQQLYNAMKAQPQRVSPQPQPYRIY